MKNKMKKVRVIGASAPTRYIRHYYGRSPEGKKISRYKIHKCLTSEDVKDILDYIEEYPELSQAEVDRLYKSIEFRKDFF